ncbi:TOTE conflict system archaeo-eukaryotic primase domain-containing protein [Rhizobium sp. IY2]|uniref:TOTE conflict system archaeo-eukaryotic primase domain-containing protein n=1 Tax=Rhizobium sp. IY2 TaxID=3397853 RepID=UPI0039DF3DA1
MSSLPTDTTINNESRAYAERFHVLFAGATTHHGTYRHEPTLVEPGEKMSIRGSARTIREPPTPTLWERHLDGAAPLGICPLRPDDTCLWGCIDDDDRKADHAALVRRVRAAGLSAIVCRSKSGGAHLYFFLSSPMPAVDLQQKLREIATSLGYPPETEIFPKQARNSDIDKTGGWLNVPYFGGDGTDRYAVKDSGLAQSVAEFLDLAERSSVTPAQLMALKASPDRPNSAHAGGDLTSDEFEKMLARWLRKLAEAPHGTRDDKLMRVARDVGRCSAVITIDKPAAEWRAREVWRKLGKNDQEFDEQWKHNVEWGEKEGNPPRLGDGDGGGGRFPDIDRIVVLVGGEEDEWRLTLRGWGDIVLPVKEVMHYYTFNVRCAARLGAIFDQVKQDTWYEKLREARAQATFEKIPETETPEYEMRELLRVFVTDKHRAETLDEVLLGKPYLDEDEGRRYFLFKDFQKFLLRGDSSFGRMKPNIAGRWVRRAIGTENLIETKKMIKGKPVKVHYVPAELFDATPKLPLPKTERPPI